MAERAIETSGVSASALKEYIHYVPILFFIFGFGYLPVFSTLTPVGMRIIGVFLGVIYGWTFTERFVPAILGMLSLCFLEGQTPGTILRLGLGTEMVWFLLLMFLFMNLLDEAGVTEYTSNWVMSREFLNGKPWLLTFFFLLAAFLIGTVNLVSSMLFLWQILYKVCDKAGYKRYTKYPTIMVIGISLFAVWGFVSMPFQSQALLLTTAFASVSGIQISFLDFTLFSLPMVLVGMLTFMCITKYIVKLDLTALKDVDMSNAESDKGLDKRQKYVLAAVGLIVFMLFGSGTFPKAWAITKLLKTFNMFGAVALPIAILLVVKIDGKPVMNFQSLMKRGIAWPIIFSFGIVLPMARLLTSDNTGVKEMFTIMLKPVEALPGYAFVLFILLAAFLLTNVASNNAIAITLIPIIWEVSKSSATVNPAALIMMLIFTVNLAFLTPAASGFAAILHSNTEWFNPKTATKYVALYLFSLFGVVITFGYFWANIIA